MPDRYEVRVHHESPGLLGTTVHYGIWDTSTGVFIPDSSFRRAWTTTWGQDAAVRCDNLNARS